MKNLILLALSLNAFAAKYSLDEYMKDRSKIFCENSKVKNCEAKHRQCARELFNSDEEDSKKFGKIFDTCLKKYGL